MRLCSAFNVCIQNYWNTVAQEVFFRIELGNFLGQRSNVIASSDDFSIEMNKCLTFVGFSWKLFLTGCNINTVAICICEGYNFEVRIELGNFL